MSMVSKWSLHGMGEPTYCMNGRRFSGGIPLRPLYVVTPRENKIGAHTKRNLRDVEDSLARSPLRLRRRSWATMSRSTSSAKSLSLSSEKYQHRLKAVGYNNLQHVERKAFIGRDPTK